MALCGIIKHHNKNENPCVLGFWHFLTSESIAGFSASLSAQSPVNRKIYRTFFIIILACPSKRDSGFALAIELDDKGICP